MKDVFIIFLFTKLQHSQIINNANQTYNNINNHHHNTITNNIVCRENLTKLDLDTNIQHHVITRGGDCGSSICSESSPDDSFMDDEGTYYRDSISWFYFLFFSRVYGFWFSYSDQYWNHIFASAGIISSIKLKTFDVQINVETTFGVVMHWLVIAFFFAFCISKIEMKIMFYGILGTEIWHRKILKSVFQQLLP